MTTLDTTHTGTGSKSIAAMSFSFATLTARFAAQRERRATRAALEKLSDRELDDIGLTRDEIRTRF